MKKIKPPKVDFEIGVSANMRTYLVSLEDVDLCAYSWRVRKFGVGALEYVHSSRLPFRQVLMHRVILERMIGRPLRTHELTDHINHSGTDNRRINLRVVTKAQNNANQQKTRGTSKFKGVWWDSTRAQWSAGIKVKGKQIGLGRFATEMAAARAYDVAAVEYFGDYALLNKPREANGPAD